MRTSSPSAATRRRISCRFDRCSVSCMAEWYSRVDVRSTKSLGDGVPIHHVPPSGDVVRPAILVFQIVRVLPDIETEDGGLTLHEGVVLVGRARDRELAAVLDQPCPSGAKPTGSG